MHHGASSGATKGFKLLFHTCKRSRKHWDYQQGWDTFSRDASSLLRDVNMTRGSSYFSKIRNLLGTQSCSKHLDYQLPDFWCLPHLCADSRQHLREDQEVALSWSRVTDLPLVQHHRLVVGRRREYRICVCVDCVTRVCECFLPVGVQQQPVQRG